MQQTAIAVEFADASFTIQKLLLQMESDLAELRSATIDYCDLARERAHQSWQEWPQTLEKYRLALNQLPGELRKREFVKNLTLELDRLDTAAKNYFATKSASWNEASANLHEKVENFKHQLQKLSENPLIEKCLRGEKILASRKSIQWNRKIGHMFLGLFFLWMFRYSGWNETFIYVSTGLFLVWAFSLETARHMSPRVNDWVCKYFKPVMREREKTKINSAIFYILSMLIVQIVFPRDITLLTMLFLAIGDPVAGIVGVKFGRHRVSSHTSWEGLAACFAVCALSAFIAAKFLFVDVQLGGFATVAFALLAGVVGAYAESSLKFLDDNLVMPLISAPLLWMLVQILK